MPLDHQCYWYSILSLSSLPGRPFFIFLSSSSSSGLQTLLWYYLLLKKKVSDPPYSPPLSGLGDSRAWWHNSEGAGIMQMETLLALLCARLHPQHSTNMDSFKLYCSPLNYYYLHLTDEETKAQWELKVTQLEIDQAGILSQAVWPVAHGISIHITLPFKEISSLSMHSFIW